MLYQNRTAKVTDRVEDLLKRMTLDEKIAQLGSISSYVKGHRLFEKGKFNRQLVKRSFKHGLGQISRLAGWGRIGISVETGMKSGNEIQKFLMTKTRLKIPAIVHEECLAGLFAQYASIFPQAITQASSWEPEVIGKVAAAIRRQVRLAGGRQVLSPVVDIVREPRWGRVEEMYAEDPYFVSIMGNAYVAAMQGKNMKHGIACTLKHFGGHGFSEGGRNLAPVNIGDRVFNEEYMFSFESCVKTTKPESIMNAYCEVDGVPSSVSKELLSGLLRDKWQWKGLVVSDYGAIEMNNNLHKFTSIKTAAARSINAGLDVELPDLICYKELKACVKEGLVTEETIDRSVRRVLSLKFRLGLFEKPYVKIPKMSVFDNVNDRRISLEAARKSLVLLKNSGEILPLKNVKSLAVVGPNADNLMSLLGDYHYREEILKNNLKNVPKLVTLLSGIKKLAGRKVKVKYAKGCELMGSDMSKFPEAVSAAYDSDVIIAAVGEQTALLSAEGFDLTKIELAGVQEEFLKELKKTGKPLIVILFNGRQLAFPWVKEHADAIIEAWYPGEEGGNALAEVLFGKVNPSGKLTVTFPIATGQIPFYYGMKPSSFRVYVGQAEPKPLYAFGHGFSYTTFKYSDLKIIKKSLEPNEDLEVSLKVTNTGKMDGAEVVQLYIRDVEASVTRPVQQLRGFKKIYLKKGKSVKLTFKMPLELAACVNYDRKFMIEAGKIEVQIGSASDDIRLKGSVTIKHDLEINERTKFVTETLVESTKYEVQKGKYKVRSTMYKVKAKKGKKGKKAIQYY